MIALDGGEVVAEDTERLLHRADVPWPSFRGARILVTGGTGFVGPWLLRALVAADDAFDLGLRVEVLSRDPGGFAARHPRLVAARPLHLVAGDVRDAVLPDGPLTHVIHAATVASARLERDDPATMEEVCREGTRRVLAHAAACGAGRVLLVSSGAVYAATSPGGRFTEEMPTDPAPGEASGAYATGKRASEALVRAAAAGGCGATIARVFALVGPGLPLDGHFALGNFLRDAIAGGPIVVRGDGTAVRSYLYAADLVAWLLAILARGAAGRAYNVGGDEAIAIGDLARRVATVAGGRFPDRPPPRVVIEGGEAIASAPSVYLPDCTRARRELGLVVVTPLDEAIRRTMAAIAG